MPYLGNTPSTSFATVVKDSFSGDGSETAFTLSKVATTNSVSVFVENVRQEPTTAYAVSGTTLTFTAAPPNASNNIYVLHMNPTTTTTHPAAQNLTAVDGTFTGDVSVGDDLTLASDSAVLSFGADSDVTITHDPDDGLIFKSTATADDNPLLLTLQTGETDLAANDVIGKIAFQAPDEGTGTDAVLVSAAIQAVAEGDHSASSNATKLGFMTGASEAATEKMSLSSAGDLTISRTADSGTVRLNLENTGSGGSTDYSEIKFNSTAGSTVTSIVQHRNNSGMNIGTSTAHPLTLITSGNTAISVDANGHVTMPKQPAFLAYPNGDQSNMANDATMVLDQEIYDQNSDYNTSNYTFTAPVTGKYLMCVASRIDNADTSANWVRIELVTSNRSYSTSLVSPDVSPYMSIDYSIIVDMDASDTCYLRWGQSGGSATADMSDVTRWSGALIC